MREEDYNILHGLRPLSGIKRVAWSPPVPLEAVKRVKDHFGCTVNDVLLSAAAAALARYVRMATDKLVAEAASLALPKSGGRSALRTQTISQKMRRQAKTTC